MKRFFINELSEDIITKFNISFFVKTPSGVLKELIENSLDALSSDICIHVEDFGVNLIKVIDNGCGVYKDDLLKIGLRFNTSKISKINDLNSIKTYGFRGESLYFVRALSKLNIISKPYDQSFAYKICFLERNENGILSITAGANGTTIEVKDLFYNNVELKNFSKDFIDERNDIIYVLSCMVLSRFDVRFVFYSNGVELYNFPICNNSYAKIRRIESFYTWMKIDNVIDVNYINDLISVYGFIYFNDTKRKNKRFNFFFVNNRIIKSDIIDRILQEIFLSLNKSVNLSYCLYLYLEYCDYIVFLSSDKTDISFKNYYFVYKFLFDSLYKVINSNIFSSSNIFVKNNNFDLIKKSNSVNNDKFFCMRFFNRGVFKNFDNIISILDDMNLLFHLDNKVFFIKINLIRERVLNKLFSFQYLKYGKILKKDILYFDLFSLDVFYIFLEFKNILLLYGFVFEVFNDKFLVLKSIPVLLYNLSVDWVGLFLELRIFFERSIFSSFSISRFDINIINIYIKYVYEKSKFNNYEVSFFYKELVFASINDILWFKKNCHEVICKNN